MQTGGRSVARILDYALQFGGHLVSVREAATLLAGKCAVYIQYINCSATVIVSSMHSSLCIAKRRKSQQKAGN
jgi:hypothetical protein